VAASEMRTSNTTRWHLYVGGRPRRLSLSPELSPRMSGFVGCLSHLYVDDSRFQLAKAAADLIGIPSHVQTRLRDIRRSKVLIFLAHIGNLTLLMHIGYNIKASDSACNYDIVCLINVCIIIVILKI